MKLDASICLGELGRDGVCFDHSWIEVKGEIFDTAISKPLVAKFDGAPVFASRDLQTLCEPFWKYGTSSGIGDDPFVQIIKSGSFATFMDNASFHRNGLWHFVQKFGHSCGLGINLNKTRQKYVKVEWRLK